MTDLNSSAPLPPVRHDGDGIVRGVNPSWEERKVPPVDVSVCDRWRAYRAEGASPEVAAMLVQTEYLRGIDLTLHAIACILDIVQSPERLMSYIRQCRMIDANLEKSDEAVRRQDAAEELDRKINAPRTY